jgi:hypothetical protein
VNAGGAASGRGQQGLRVLDEALRLLDALQAPRPAVQTEDEPHRGGECRICPVCRGLATLRELDPEAVARMGRALIDLAAVFGEFATGRTEDSDHGHHDERAPDPADAPPRPVRLQRIDVTD